MINNDEKVVEEFAKPKARPRKWLRHKSTPDTSRSRSLEGNSEKFTICTPCNSDPEDEEAGENERLRRPSQSDSESDSMGTNNQVGKKSNG